LELCAQKHGVLAGGDRTAAKDFHGQEAAQLFYLQRLDAGANALEGDLVVEDEGEVAIDRRIARNGRVADVFQRMLVETFEVEFGEEDILL